MWPVSSTELANILRSGTRRNEIKDCSMRKTIENSETELAPENASWLDLFCAIARGILFDVLGYSRFDRFHASGSWAGDRKDAPKVESYIRSISARILVILSRAADKSLCG
jgi:hypothetical protein